MGSLPNYTTAYNHSAAVSNLSRRMRRIALPKHHTWLFLNALHKVRRGLC